MSRAHVYKRDHINTDEIIPARYLNTDDEMELASHCLEDLDGDFVSKVSEGDVIVAGDDFGCGSVITFTFAHSDEFFGVDVTVRSVP